MLELMRTGAHIGASSFSAVTPLRFMLLMPQANSSNQLAVGMIQQVRVAHRYAIIHPQTGAWSLTRKRSTVLRLPLQF